MQFVSQKRFDITGVFHRQSTVGNRFAMRDVRGANDALDFRNGTWSDAELPQTDVAVYAGAAYFRQDDSHYYLGVSLVIPGSQIPFVQAKDRDNATIDIIGTV